MFHKISYSSIRKKNAALVSMSLKKKSYQPRTFGSVCIVLPLFIVRFIYIYIYIYMYVCVCVCVCVCVRVRGIIFFCHLT